MTRQNKPLSKMLLQRQIELFQIWGTVRKIWFWKQMFKFHDIICCRLDFLISQLSLNMPSFICFSISDTSDWNCCSLAGSIFANSSETLLNLAIVCCAKRPNCELGNAFSEYFSSPIRYQQEHLLDQQFYVQFLDSHSQMTHETASLSQQYWDKFFLSQKSIRISPWDSKK